MDLLTRPMISFSVYDTLILFLLLCVVSLLLSFLNLFLEWIRDRLLIAKEKRKIRKNL